MKNMLKTKQKNVKMVCEVEKCNFEKEGFLDEQVID